MTGSSRGKKKIKKKILIPFFLEKKGFFLFLGKEQKKVTLEIQKGKIRLNEQGTGLAEWKKLSFSSHLRERERERESGMRIICTHTQRPLFFQKGGGKEGRHWKLFSISKQQHPPPPTTKKRERESKTKTKASSFAYQILAETSSECPTNNALSINFRLSSDAEILLISTDWACKIGAKRAKNMYALCTYSNWASIFAYHLRWLGGKKTNWLSFVPSFLWLCLATAFFFWKRATGCPKKTHFALTILVCYLHRNMGMFLSGSFCGTSCNSSFST